MLIPHPTRAGLAFIVAMGLTVSVTLAETPVGGPPRRARVVHRFDFDETPLGNVEETPMYWTSLHPADFPAFSQGRFDRTGGRSAAPSFHLTSEGRNVGYLYSGPDTRVRPGAKYRVEGFIRPDQLTHARACLGVHYVDREGGVLLETMVRSRYIGGTAESSGWIAVELSLPPAPPDALTIGVTAWVMQERMWNDASRLRRAIDPVDVRGGAWFDDITVYRLPLVNLSSSVPGNVLSPGDPKELGVELNDPDGQELTAEVTVRDAVGQVVLRGTIRQESQDAGSLHRFDVSALGPGLYRASMTVTANSGDLDAKSLTFAVLGPRMHTEDSIPRSFGVAIRDPIRTDGGTELSLLKRQGVRSVKYPVWANWGGADETPASAAGLDRFLSELSRWGVSPTAVLGGPPASVGGNERWSSNPLLEILGSNSASWSDDLAAVAAPYAGIFRWWQLGSDDNALDDQRDRFTGAAENLRAALSRFITGPQLAAVRRSREEAVSDRLPIEQLTLALGRDVDTHWLGPWFKEFERAGYEQIAIHVPPLPESPFDRKARLADWSQRVIGSRHAGASIVYVPQTWTTRETGGEFIAEPTEEFLVLRTIADALGDSRPGPELYVAAGVRCLAFESRNAAVMALWDESAPPEGRIHAMQLGAATRQTDLWGRSSPLERNAEGLQLIHLSSLPTFVDRVDGWLVEVSRSVTMQPNWVQSGSDFVRHVVSIGGPGVPGVSGTLTLDGPKSLEITPRTVPFRTVSNEASPIEVVVRYPHSEPAGLKPFHARLTTAADRRVIEVALPVQVGVQDLEVAGTAIAEGTDLVLQHVISNRSKQTLNFRGSAAVPGRERQYRPISNLGPGETQTMEYRFSQAADLIGRQVRLMIRELNDGPRTHTLELTVQ